MPLYSRRCPLNQTDHLALQLVRLNGGETHLPNVSGLTFVFAKGGSGRCVTLANTPNLKPGDIMILNGAAGGKLSAPDRGEFLFWNFSVCFENLLPLFSSREITLLHKLTEGFREPTIYPANNPLAAECQRLLATVPPQFNLDHRGQLIRIAATILSAELKEAQSRQSGYVSAEDHMVQVFEKLSSNEIINLSVGELAEKFSCSRRHLNRLFHQHFGVSVASLRMEMRLLKAMSLLRDPDAKIIYIAEQCGFNHLGLFNTCFKRRFGASPGQWRKTNLQGGNVRSLVGDSKPLCPLQSSGLCPRNTANETAAKAVRADDSARNALHRNSGLGILAVTPTPSKRSQPGAKSGA